MEVLERGLKEFCLRVQAASGPAEIMAVHAPEILGMFGAERVTLYALDESRGELFSVFKVGEELREIRVPLDKRSLAGYSAVTGRVLNVRDAYDARELASIDPELRFDDRWDRATGFRTRQVLVAPLLFEGRVYGVIQLLNRLDGTPFGPEHELRVREVAEILAVAFHNQRRIASGRRTKFDWLLAHGYLTQEQLDRAILAARSRGRTVEEVLLQELGLDKELLLRSLSDFYGCPYELCPEELEVSRELVAGLSASYLRRALWCPVRREGGRTVVLVDDPHDLRKLQEIQAIVGGPLELRVALRGDILRLVGRLFSSGRGADELVRELGGEAGPEEEEPEQISESDSAIVQLAHRIIEDAHRMGASDVHLEPRGRREAVVRFRVDGRLEPYLRVPAGHFAALLIRFKVMAGMDIAERRRPQDGRIRYWLPEGRPLELRVVTVPTVQGEDMVMRLLRGSHELIPLERIGMSPQVLEAFRAAVRKPYGLVLVVGPTGSGKTTTLHSALAFINSPERKIWTAEDPVEITQEGLRQVQVHPKIGFTFAAAMRSFLRADPDVIMIGEMRDLETAETAVEASLTGHLVLSTLHTNNAPETITRLLEMGLDPLNFADSLLVVLAQRLVRTLCPECKRPYEPSPEELSLLRWHYGQGFEQALEGASPLRLFRPQGCPRCQGRGFRGRMGVFELLVNSPRIKQSIYGRARAEEIRQLALEEGMKTLMQDGIEKVLHGLTCFEEVLSVCAR